jgi:hypothetical protein
VGRGKVKNGARRVYRLPSAIFVTCRREASENCGSPAAAGDHRAAKLRSHKVFGSGAQEIENGFIQRFLLAGY